MYANRRLVEVVVRECRRCERRTLTTFEPYQVVQAVDRGCASGQDRAVAEELTTEQRLEAIEAKLALAGDALLSLYKIVGMPAMELEAYGELDDEFGPRPDTGL